MQNAIYEAKDVTLISGEGNDRSVVFSDASFSIRKGDFIAITGVSPREKSSLTKLLGLLVAPASGTLLFRERPVSEYSEVELGRRRRDEIGFIFRTPQLLSEYTVLQNVELPLLYAQELPTSRRSLVFDALALLGIAHRLNDLPSSLSCEEQQLVAIARAVINRPEILLVDDATDLLDTVTKDRFLDLLSALRTEGGIVIAFTDRQEVRSRASMQLWIEDGKLSVERMEALKT